MCGAATIRWRRGRAPKANRLLWWQRRGNPRFRKDFQEVGMSGSFGDREKAFESKFAHDEELKFRIVNRRNKLLGLWAAEQMGISSAEADAYARSVVQADFEEPGHEDVVRKIQKDFAAKNVARSDHAIRLKMDELLAVATDQITKEAK
jgi:hypothetical protein